MTTVSPEALSPGGTRSEATADVEDLLYIVNFARTRAGYAILGADDRLEPVMRSSMKEASRPKSSGMP